MFGWPSLSTRSYFWLLYALSALLAVYFLRGPLKIQEMLAWPTLQNLSPKFYVALTGTSSLVSGIILIFEWWYFKNNNLDVGLGSEDGSDYEDTIENGKAEKKMLEHENECVVIRNPMALFRGADYERYLKSLKKDPLTFLDKNMSSVDCQTVFCCDADNGKKDMELMHDAWRQKDMKDRIQMAKEALQLNSECAAALILLAEEDCITLSESEELLKKALKPAEVQYKKSQLMAHLVDGSAARTRDMNLLVYIRRRLAMIFRRQGKCRDAIKIYRDIIKEYPLMNVMNIHENLIEALLEQRCYADAQAVLSKYDGYIGPNGSSPKSAVICYTSALLKTRLIAEKFEADSYRRRGLSLAEANALESIQRAVEFNPHVPLYLLELKPLILPAEHILKRGDTEAISYAFFHLTHWKRIEGALDFLQYNWESTFRIVPNPIERGHCFPPYPSQTSEVEKELIPAIHSQSFYPKRSFPFGIIFTTILCIAIAIGAIFLNQFPQPYTELIDKISTYIWVVATGLTDYAHNFVPENIMALLASKSPIPPGSNPSPTPVRN